MSTDAKSGDFPPKEVGEIVAEVAKLLKERGETISVAETVGQMSLKSTRMRSSKLIMYIGSRWHHIRISSLHARRISIL